MSESPVSLLRQAAEAMWPPSDSPLPTNISALVYDYLIECAEAGKREPDPSALAIAREVLALAEQQQTRPDTLAARTWLATELHNAGACEPGGEEDGQVVCDENCKNLARMAQDVFLGGPIDWTKEER